MDNAKIGENLWARRTALGLSQPQLVDHMKAEGFPWNQSTASRVEAGTRPLHFLEALAVESFMNFDLVTRQPEGRSHPALPGIKVAIAILTAREKELLSKALRS